MAKHYDTLVPFLPFSLFPSFLTHERTPLTRFFKTSSWRSPLPFPFPCLSFTVTGRCLCHDAHGGTISTSYSYFFFSFPPPFFPFLLFPPPTTTVTDPQGERNANLQFQFPSPLLPFPPLSPSLSLCQLTQNKRPHQIRQPQSGPRASKSIRSLPLLPPSSSPPPSFFGVAKPRAGKRTITTISSSSFP